MNNEEARDLLKKYLDGHCTPEEKGLLESWYLRYERRDIAELTSNEKQRSLEKIRASLPGGQPVAGPSSEARPDGGRLSRQTALRYKTDWRGIAAAIIVLLAAGLGWYLYTSGHQRDPERQAAGHADYMLPGGDKAFLTLADGRKISLTDAAEGKLASQAGVTLSKTEDGQLVYQMISDAQQAGTEPANTQPADFVDPKEIPWNTVETPRGGQYRLTLPDGSKVWLNAASSLKYPASFAGLSERRVILDGEAYFEVTRDDAKPFRVTGARQEVEVLGTRFNIYNYQDEAVVRTTLLEGSLRVRAENTGTTETGGKSGQGRLLRPGEQSSLSAAGLEVTKVDTEGAVAWKNGLFLFNSYRLDHIMLLIARWYDIEVAFADPEMKDDRFSGTVSRFAHATQVLQKLELTGGVQFTVQDRTVIVSRPAPVH